MLVMEDNASRQKATMDTLPFGEGRTPKRAANADPETTKRDARRTALDTKQIPSRSRLRVVNYRRPEAAGEAPGERRGGRLGKALVSKSMVAYSQKMRQLTDARRSGGSEEPPAGFRRLLRQTSGSMETPETGTETSTECFFKGCIPKGDKPTIARSISEPPPTRGHYYKAPYRELRRFGIGSNLARQSRIKGEINVLSLVGGEAETTESRDVRPATENGNPMGIIGHLAKIHRTNVDWQSRDQYLPSRVYAVSRQPLPSAGTNPESGVWTTDDEGGSVDISEYEQRFRSRETSPPNTDASSKETKGIPFGSGTAKESRMDRRPAEGMTAFGAESGSRGSAPREQRPTHKADSDRSSADPVDSASETDRRSKYSEAFVRSFLPEVVTANKKPARAVKERTKKRKTAKPYASSSAQDGVLSGKLLDVLPLTVTGHVTEDIAEATSDAAATTAPVRGQITGGAHRLDRETNADVPPSRVGEERRKETKRNSVKSKGGSSSSSSPESPARTPKISDQAETGIDETTESRETESPERIGQPRDGATSDTEHKATVDEISAIAASNNAQVSKDDDDEGGGGAYVCSGTSAASSRDVADTGSSKSIGENSPEASVQRAHLRLFGQKLKQEEIKKRLGRNRRVQAERRKERVRQKPPSRPDAPPSEPERQADETSPKKTKKSVQFGPDMIREVTKIQYPWNVQESSEGEDDDVEDDDDDDDEGNSQDDEGNSQDDEGNSQDDEGNSQDDEGNSQDDEGNSQDGEADDSPADVDDVADAGGAPNGDDDVRSDGAEESCEEAESQ